MRNCGILHPPQIVYRTVIFNLFVLVIIEAHDVLLGEQVRTDNRRTGTTASLPPPSWPYPKTPTHPQQGGIPESDLLNLRSLWFQLDPHGVGIITRQDLFQLLSKVPPPLGFGKDWTFREKLGRMTEMGFSEGVVTFKAFFQRTQDYVYEQENNKKELRQRMRLIQVGGVCVV